MFLLDWWWRRLRGFQGHSAVLFLHAHGSKSKRSMEDITKQIFENGSVILGIIVIAAGNSLYFRRKNRARVNLFSVNHQPIETGGQLTMPLKIYGQPPTCFTHLGRPLKDQITGGGGSNWQLSYSSETEQVQQSVKSFSMKASQDGSQLHFTSLFISLQ